MPLLPWQGPPLAVGPRTCAAPSGRGAGRGRWATRPSCSTLPGRVAPRAGCTGRGGAPHCQAHTCHMAPMVLKNIWCCTGCSRHITCGTWYPSGGMAPPAAKKNARPGYAGHRAGRGFNMPLEFLASSTAVIDSGLVAEVLDLVKSCAGLFNIFPINVFMIGSLAAMGFRLFSKAKRVAVS